MKDSGVIQAYLKTQASKCFDLLYERYSSKVYAKCISMLKEDSLAHDATQEIFTKVYLSLSKFKQQSSFSTWVYSITYNYCIDFIRRNKKRKHLFNDETEKLPDQAEEDLVNDEELLEMKVGHLKKVLGDLPGKDSAILLMKYQDGMSIQEIGFAMELSESAVKMRIKRAKERAKTLKETYFSEYDY